MRNGEIDEKTTSVEHKQLSGDGNFTPSQPSFFLFRFAVIQENQRRLAHALLYVHTRI